MSSKRKFRLGGSYVTMIISISLVLLVLGLTALLLLHSEKLSNYIKENIELTVMFKEDAPQAEMLALQKKLEMNEYVKGTYLVSPDEAADRLLEDTGEDFSFLGFNPLPYSLDVYVKGEYATEETLEELKTLIEKEPLVKDAHYDKMLVQEINVNAGRISLFLLGFALLVFIISFGLISNTIRLAIYSKRFLIRSMVLVGATRAFIRRPYLWQAVWMGAVASLFAIVLLEGLMIVIYRQLPDLEVIQSDLHVALVFAGLLLSGIFISWVSSFSALNRYIRMKTDYLYA
ncbi:MAG: cell division protein FtsX [Marinilabiliales bacterium]|nr:MAG: cell division protein FtsX [Marinilabiliales bacterium]